MQMTYKRFIFLLSLFISVSAYADIGAMASNLNSSMSSISNLIGSVGYIAGLAFGVAAVFKFKQHRDSPTQVPVGTPFAMLGTAVALVYLPVLLTQTGETFDSGATVTGATGEYGTIG